MANPSWRAGKAYETLMLKAAADPGFRQELLRDPRAMIFRELGIALPDEVRIEVIEEAPGLVYLVVPSPDTVPEARQLSDEEIASVAGGTRAATGAGTLPGIDAGVKRAVDL